MKTTPLSLALAALLASLPASADTIDFEQLASGGLGAQRVLVDGVTFNGANKLYNLSPDYLTGQGGAICALDQSDRTCQGDMKVRFNGKVEGVKLTSIGYNNGDSVTITVFSRQTILGSVTVESDGTIDLSSFTQVTKLMLDDSSTGAGLGFGKFRFKRLSEGKSHERGSKKTH